MLLVYVLVKNEKKMAIFRLDQYNINSHSRFNQIDGNGIGKFRSCRMIFMKNKISQDQY
jgi:hypothetical protein